jgi:hypothetical protein
MTTVSTGIGWDATGVATGSVVALIDGCPVDGEPHAATAAAHATKKMTRTAKA